MYLNVHIITLYISSLYKRSCRGFLGGWGGGEIMKNHTVCSSIVVHFCLGHKFETKR